MNAGGAALCFSFERNVKSWSGRGFPRGRLQIPPLPIFADTLLCLFGFAIELLACQVHLELKDDVTCDLTWRSLGCGIGREPTGIIRDTQSLKSALVNCGSSAAWQHHVNHSIHLHIHYESKKALNQKVVFLRYLSSRSVGVSDPSTKLTRTDVAQQECRCRKRPGNVMGKTSPISFHRLTPSWVEQLWPTL